MATRHYLHHLEEPKAPPAWAVYQVIIHAEDGRHEKFYQGFVRANMEFRRQVGENRDLKDVFIDRFCHNAENYDEAYQRTAEKYKDWNLEQHVNEFGHFEVIDDWGRRVVIERIKT